MVEGKAQFNSKPRSSSRSARPQHQGAPTAPNKITSAAAALPARSRGDLAGALPAAGSEVVRGRCEDARASECIEHLESLGDHLWANPSPPMTARLKERPACGRRSLLVVVLAWVTGAS